MRVRLLPAGDTALLVDFSAGDFSAGDFSADDVAVDDEADDVLALTGALHAAELPGVLDLVPAARTVFVQATAGVDLGELEKAIAAIAAQTTAAGATESDAAEVRIPVRYDGPDLDDVCALTGLTRAEVIARHTETVWRAAFIGFAPGFAYLTGSKHGLDVPRRDESRTVVPAGAVALAGGYTAVYPSASPGGWQLIGQTEVRMWDVDRNPLSLIRPGDRVRFVDVARAGSLDTDGPVNTGGPKNTGGSVRADGSGTTGVVTSGFEVLRTGPLSLFQDLGRGGYAAFGVGRSGAADRESFRTANRLLCNDDDATVIECVLGGLRLRALGDAVIAISGAPAPLAIDGIPADHAAPITVRAGQVVALGTPSAGLRTYLAARGGFDVPMVLGSRSTDTLSGLGPPPIRRGDLLGVGQASTNTLDPDPDPDPDPDRDSATQPTLTLPRPTGTVTVRAIAGPRDDWFEQPTDLGVGEWVVSPNSNRVGIRLDRPVDVPAHQAPVLRRKDFRELASEGLALGSIQVPPSGQPVLFLADHPVTGGYPVIAVVRDADIDLAAQLRPGQRLCFQFITR